MNIKLLLVCLFSLHASEARLNSIILIHRHADRTPVITYPNDPYSCHWKQGFGVITEGGLERMRQFGKILRANYGSFWPEKNNLTIQSSRVDRVVKSLYAMLEGIYSDDFLFNPVSIKALPTEIDTMLYPIITECPVYTEEVDRVFNLPETLDWFNSLNLLWTYLTDKTGMDLMSLNAADRLSIVNIEDVFLVQKQFNLELPKWMTNDVYNQLVKAAIHQMRLIYSTPLLQRLAAGMIFQELRNQINAIENGEKYEKIRIYSTHDVKLAAVMMGLNVFNDVLPPYGSMLVFEFHSEGFLRPKNYIRSYYLNDTATGTFHPLNIDGCDSTLGCRVDQLGRRLDNLIPVNWATECKSKIGSL